ncbi:MAG: energy transducer TonB [Bacteroidales bacterium]
MNTDGIVSDVEILKGVDPSLDNEAVRVVESSPEWVAGKQNGKLVNVRMTITVNFQLH